MGKIKDRQYRRTRADSRSDSSVSPPSKSSREHREHQTRRKSRSRSRERRKRDRYHHRSRSHDRKDRVRRRSRSRSRSPHRMKGRKRERFEKDRHSGTNRKSPSRQSDPKIDQVKSKSDDSSLEAAKKIQERMEEEMKKRRERMEAWRQKMKDSEENVEDVEGKKSQWTLEDENEDNENTTVPVDEENTTVPGDEESRTVPMDDKSTVPVDDESTTVPMDDKSKTVPMDDKSTTVPMDDKSTVPDDKSTRVPVDEENASQQANGDSKEDVEKEKEGGKEADDDEDIDPLDAFMVGVQEEVKKIHTATQRKSGTQVSTVMAIKPNNSTVVSIMKVQKKKKIESNGPVVGPKGELLHNDQDAMEYSEEEEEGDDELVSALKSIAKKGKGKELPTVDHTRVEYTPFRKDFYVEVPELTRMTKKEVAAYRTELESIKIKGKLCPNPIKTWAQCGMASKILDVIKKNKYEKPTPIQTQAIPAIMSGRDLIGIAKTGSGKTLAFLLPMFRHILDQHPLEADDGPIAVILTPTRELAIQIYNESRKFGKLLKLWTVCVYGGTGISEQIADLKRGTEIIVCTPGRMIDMLAANGGRVTNLRRTTYLVLDEADRMFDMGFEPQVMKIISNIRPDRQTVLFSATFPRPMEALARKILTKPIEVQVGGRSVVCKDVHQTAIVIDDHQKFFKLLELLGIYYEKGSVLVFVERQEAADALIRDLMKSSYSCMALHGGMDQFDRDSTIADFKNGSIKILVATSVAARGLDVKNLILVVNYDCPNHYEDYVHRCGRTGRAGNKGFAYTFVTKDQVKLTGDIIKALELSGCPVPEDLDDIWKKYMEKLKAEGKIKSLPSGRVVPIIKKRKAIGFTGKGFKFDDKEAARNAESKLKQKSALGLANDEDEDEFALLTLDKKLDNIFGNKVTVHDPNASVLPSVLSKPGILPTPPQSERLSQATAIANKIMLSKKKAKTLPSASLGSGLAAQEAAISIMKGGIVNFSGAVLASQIAAGINAKVGAGPANAKNTFLPVGTIIPGQEKDIPEHSLIKYSDEVEINSFPQQIRFRITTREVLDDIGELAESYVTVRGIYVPESRAPKEGEKKLFLSLEAKSERAIQVAKQEIKRVIKEEAQRMVSRIKPHQQTGRYSVI